MNIKQSSLAILIIIASTNYLFADADDKKKELSNEIDKAINEEYIKKWDKSYDKGNYETCIKKCYSDCDQNSKDDCKTKCLSKCEEDKNRKLSEYKKNLLDLSKNKIKEYPFIYENRKEIKQSPLVFRNCDEYTPFNVDDNKYKHCYKCRDNYINSTLSLLTGGEADTNTNAAGIVGFIYQFHNKSRILTQFNYGASQKIKSAESSKFGNSMLNPNLAGYGFLCEYNRYLLSIFTKSFNHEKPDEYNKLLYGTDIYFKGIIGFTRFSWHYDNNYLNNILITNNITIPLATDIDILYVKAGLEWEIFNRNARINDKDKISYLNYRFTIMMGYSLRFLGGGINDQTGKIIQRLTINTITKYYSGLVFRVSFYFEESSLFAEYNYHISPKGIDGFSGSRFLAGLQARANIFKVGFEDDGKFNY